MSTCTVHNTADMRLLLDNRLIHVHVHVGERIIIRCTFTITVPS